jgi:hypothetical protein
VLVVAGEELGLVGGDVDLDGAVAAAALAGQAEVERLLDVRRRLGHVAPEGSPSF